ncbi:MAG: cytochrome c oxidase assembly protein, partial [Alphaproteobacteria bacterium]|nr:cytochrome c oxidase assembly protein [Alphaproteobacteria bacterium]
MTVRPNPAANRRVALAMGAVVVAMAGLAFAAVPLYRVFCQVTGYGGT